MLNGLLHRYPELAQVARAGIVHRLDKDTSGLMVVARNETAQTHLVRQLQARSMGREYIALAHGWLGAAGRVDRPIGRDARVPVRMSVERPVAPKPAVTHYFPSRRGEVDPGGRVCEVVCRLKPAARTRSACTWPAWAILCWPTCCTAARLAGAGRQMLHARALHFEDPAAGARSGSAPPCRPTWRRFRKTSYGTRDSRIARGDRPAVGRRSSISAPRAPAASAWRHDTFNLGRRAEDNPDWPRTAGACAPRCRAAVAAAVHGADVVDADDPPRRRSRPPTPASRRGRAGCWP